jgi:hypothetical protein
LALIRKDFGFSTHDADHVELEYRINYDSGYHDLEFSFDDAQGNSQKIIFRDVLAFRWDHNEEQTDYEDTFEVMESSWLQRHLEHDFGPADSTGFGKIALTFAHYRLCFNALDLMLDVAARRID